jgi:anti-sigma factor RsiW
MCDFSRNLIAWLDHELPESEAADLERHLEACSECRSRLDAYERVSTAFDAYCEAAIASNAHPRVPRWVPVASAAGAVAALLALLLALPRAPVKPPMFHPPATAAPPTVVARAVPTPVSPIKRIDKRHAVAPVKTQNANATPAQPPNIDSLPDEPAIQIAIPAEAMFPPGALPEGVNFVADLTIRADGSAQHLRLRPRLAGFERRTTQP